MPLGDLLSKTSLGASRSALQGHRVLLSVQDQFAAAVALTELDGLAARIVLCPPDLKPEHYPTIIEGSAVDTIVTDIDPETWPGTGSLTTVRCHWPMTAAAPSDAPDVATEWLLMTSGTTGAPKMVQHDFQGLTGAIKPQASSGRPLVWATFLRHAPLWGPPDLSARHSGQRFAGAVERRRSHRRHARTIRRCRRHSHLGHAVALAARADESRHPGDQSRLHPPIG